MNSYRFTRTSNIYVKDSTIAGFPSDDEAKAAAEECHTGNELVEYNGKARPFTETEDGVPVFYDVSWTIERINPVSLKTEHALVSNEPLKPGYVYSDDLLSLVQELSTLDPDWPFDMRILRTVVRDAKEIIERLRIMGEYES